MSTHMQEFQLFFSFFASFCTCKISHQQRSIRVEQCCIFFLDIISIFFLFRRSLVGHVTALSMKGLRST